MPHSRPLVSVIVPACNAAPHLGDTIDAVLRQTLSSLELIIVDDGSTDHTAAIAEAVIARDRRVRLVRQANQGVGAARNAGIAVARGEYIAPLDADDLWAPRKLEKQIARFEHSSPRTGLVYCWSRNIDRAGRVISWAHPCRLEGVVGAALFLGNFTGNASVPMFRASTLAAVGGYLRRDQQNGAQGCEDWDLNLRIAEKFEFRCVREYLVSYRQSHDAMSLRTDAMLRSYHIAIQRALQRNPRIPAQILAWSQSRFYGYLAGKSYVWGNYASTLRYVSRILRTDPVAWLNTRNYRIGSLSLAHFLTRGALRRHRTPPPLSSDGDPCFRTEPPAAAVPQSLFAAIEQRRFTLASGIRDARSPVARAARPVFS